MQKGTITELGPKESGFIKRVGHPEPLFFHADHLIDLHFSTLHVGDKLEFIVRETNKGPYAIDIRLAKVASAS